MPVSWLLKIYISCKQNLKFLFNRILMRTRTLINFYYFQVESIINFLKMLIFFTRWLTNIEINFNFFIQMQFLESKNFWLAPQNFKYSGPMIKPFAFNLGGVILSFPQTSGF